MKYLGWALLISLGYDIPHLEIAPLESNLELRNLDHSEWLPSELPALEIPFGGQFWGGQFWVRQSSELPALFFMFDHTQIATLEIADKLSKIPSV